MALLMTPRFRSMTTAVSSSYVAITLDSLNPNQYVVATRSINSSAVLAGTSVRSTGFETACQWIAASAFDLGNFGGALSDAFAINDANQICGSATLPNGVQQAALWQEGRIRNLGSFAGSGSKSSAFALTETSDPIVYGCCELVGGSNRAVFWQQLQIQALPHDADWAFSVAKVVSYNSYPAGAVFSQSQNRQYTVCWTPAVVELPGLSPNCTSEPFSGHPSGFLVGTSNRGPGTEMEAVLFQVTQLGTPAVSIQNHPSAVRSFAFGVNEYGVVVGEYQDLAGQRSAFIYSQQSGVMQDLTILVQPSGVVTRILSAKAINKHGVIIAQADVGGTQCEVMLWPV